MAHVVHRGPFNVVHSEIDGPDTHEPFHYVSASDPGAVGAGKYWLDTSASPYGIKRRNSADSGWDVVGTATATLAPADATFITQTPNATLTNEQALSALATGVLINTTGTGVLSVVAAPTGAIVGTTDTQTLSAKTLTTPTIGSFVNAGHTHADAAGGGLIPLTSVDPAGASNGDIVKRVAGVWDNFTPAVPQFAVGYRSSGSANITSTTGTNLGSLTCSVTLASGYTWDLVAFGSINANAPAGDFIYATARVDGDTGTSWTDTGTASGERALGFAWTKAGVAGDGASHSANAVMKVGSGTGTINTGWIVLQAFPRVG